MNFDIRSILDNDGRQWKSFIFNIDPPNAFRYSSLLRIHKNCGILSINKGFCDP